MRVFAVMIAALVVVPKLGFAQTDEIQVYDAAIAGQGKFNLTAQDNFTPAGVRTPAFPGALVADQSLNGVTDGRTA
jgi:hypothetical protein